MDPSILLHKSFMGKIKNRQCQIWEKKITLFSTLWHLNKTNRICMRQNKRQAYICCFKLIINSNLKEKGL